MYYVEVDLPPLSSAMLGGMDSGMQRKMRNLAAKRRRHVSTPSSNNGRNWVNRMLSKAQQVPFAYA